MKGTGKEQIHALHILIEISFRVYAIIAACAAKNQDLDNKSYGMAWTDCLLARSQHHQKKHSRQWNNSQQYKVEVVKRNGGQHDNLLSGHYFMVSIYQVRSNSNITSPASVPVFGCSVRLC